MASDLEKGVDKVSKEVSKAAEDVKDTMNEVEGRRKRSSLEEKITTIIGLILFIRGLRYLRRFIRGIILLILGGLLFSGYFNQGLKSTIKYFTANQPQTKAKKESKKEPKKTAKPEVKKTKKKK